MDYRRQTLSSPQPEAGAPGPAPQTPASRTRSRSSVAGQAAESGGQRQAPGHQRLSEN